MKLILRFAIAWGIALMLLKPTIASSQGFLEEFLTIKDGHQARIYSEAKAKEWRDAREKLEECSHTLKPYYSQMETVWVNLGLARSSLLLTEDETPESEKKDYENLEKDHRTTVKILLNIYNGDLDINTSPEIARIKKKFHKKEKENKAIEQL